MKKSLLLLAMACGFAAQAATIEGNVTDGSAGIPDVLVTDGYEFVKTDTNGHFVLELNQFAEFVFPITPSGYEVDNFSGAQVFFYHRVDDDDFNFTLKPIGDDSEFSFFAVADPQPHDRAYDFTELTKNYKEMNEIAEQWKAEEGFTPFAVQAGDITFNIGYKQWHNTFKNEIKPCFPQYNAPGNHDHAIGYPLGDAATEDWREYYGPLYYSFNRGKVHFLVTNDVYIETEGDYTLGWQEEVWDWVAKDLQYVPEDYIVVPVQHIPITTNASKRKTFKKFFNKLLGGRTAWVLSGHTHNAQNPGPHPDFPNVEEKVMGTLCGAFWNGPICKDGTYNGYYLYHVKGTELSWQYKPSGRDALENKFRMYEPEQFTDGYFEVRPEDDKVVKINIFDWDPAWTVTWRLDGVEMGEVPRYEDKPEDPFAAYSYSDRPDLNKACTHLFHCDVPATGSVVEVTATDRFGVSLTKTMTLSSVGAVEAVAAESCGIASTEVYNINGMKVMDVQGRPEPLSLPLPSGLYILRHHHTDGSLTTSRAIK